MHLLRNTPYESHEKHISLKIATQRLEWFHLISIAATFWRLLQSVYVFFFKTSTLLLAGLTGFFIALLIDVLFLLLYVDLDMYLFDISHHFVPVTVLTVYIFLLLMTVLSRDQAAAFFLWLAGYITLLYWQVVHQGVLYLDMARATVSIPGIVLDIYIYTM